MVNKHSIFAALIGCSLLSGIPRLSFAAEAADANAASSLEEITVTARKRNESLISVPVVITAVNAAQL